MLTIDANVFISAASASEAGAAVNRTFIRRVSLLSTPLYCPTILLPEVAAGIARPTVSITLAKQVTNDVARLPSLVLVYLDKLRADLAADAAIACRLRGADAVYVAVAQEYGTTLITGDQELLTRGVTAVPTLTPSERLAANRV